MHDFLADRRKIIQHLRENPRAKLKSAGELGPKHVIEASSATEVVVTGPSTKFYADWKYEEIFQKKPDPKDLSSITDDKGRTVWGVHIQIGEDGVYDVANKVRNKARSKHAKDNSL